ncbi:MAG: hypothetical protein IID44_23710 [Planctomycetes bacterium]|nr:hypothetical protein [Planctomycetota bacterium]
MALHTASLHPDPEQLQRFSLGKLNDQRFAEIESHLEICEPCSESLDSLSSEDAFVSLLCELQQADEDTDPARASQTECSLIGSAKSDSPPPMPATLREYRLDRVLGRGGMGVVYEAWHTKLCRSVAVKVLSSELTRHPEAVTRFERELRAIGL